MILAINVSALAVLFSGLARVAVTRAGLIEVVLSGATVILGRRFTCFVVPLTWRLVTGFARLSRLVVAAIVHVGRNLSDAATRLSEFNLIVANPSLPLAPFATRATLK